MGFHPLAKDFGEAGVKGVDYPPNTTLMKYTYYFIPLLFLISCAQNTTSKQNSEVPSNITDKIVLDVDPSLFLEASLTQAVSTVACTLSDGTKTTCYKIVSASSPSDHQMGPWCPTNISDGADAGGIWIEGGEVYDVDGAFIKNMAAFYKDDTWKMYDANGDIFVTKTKEDCANAANPNVGEEYKNFCVECLPSYLSNLTQEYLIPVTPVRTGTTKTFGGGGGGAPGGRPDGPPPGGREGRPDGPPPGGGPGGRPGGGGGGGMMLRGIAFNGIRFDGPAPTHAILGAYTLAPFDDAGGHINLGAGYHYHAATGVSTKIEQEDGHAAMIGYAMDGHGLYERLDANGKEAADLDDCRGHYDEVRGYHYHVDKAGANNFINCLSGAYAE